MMICHACLYHLTKNKCCTKLYSVMLSIAWCMFILYQMTNIKRSGKNAVTNIFLRFLEYFFSEAHFLGSFPQKDCLVEG